MAFLLIVEPMGWAFLNYLSPGLFIRNFILLISRLMSLKLDSFQCVHKRGKLSLGLFILNHTQKLFYVIKHHWLCMWQFYFWFIPALAFNSSKLSESLWSQITCLGKMSDSHPYICHRQLEGCDEATDDVNWWGTEIMISDDIAYDQSHTSDCRSF